MYEVCHLDNLMYFMSEFKFTQLINRMKKTYKYDLVCVLSNIVSHLIVHMSEFKFTKLIPYYHYEKINALQETKRYIEIYIKRRYAKNKTAHLY